jgi:hypothetical protein
VTDRQPSAVAARSAGGQVQTLSGPGHRDVRHLTLGQDAGEVLAGGQRVRVGKESFFHPDDENDASLVTLRLMDRGEKGVLRFGRCLPGVDVAKREVAGLIGSTAA